MLSRVVAPVAKDFGISVGDRVAVTASCSLGAFQTIRQNMLGGLISSWIPKPSTAVLAEHMVQFSSSHDTTSHATNRLIANRLGITAIPPAVAFTPVHAEIGDPSKTIALQVSSGFKCLQLTRYQLDAQIANLRQMISFTDQLVILNTSTSSSWLLAGLAFADSSPIFLGSINLDKFPTSNFSLITDFETFLEFSTFAKPDLIKRISKIVVDLPANRTASELEICSRLFTASNFQWHCTSPETGTLFLADRSLTKIEKIPEKMDLRVEGGRLQARGDAVSVEYLDRQRSTDAKQAGAGWVKTDLVVSLKDSPVLRFEAEVVAEPAPRVVDQMEPNWEVDSMPISKMRLRHGSKGQVYFTNKSQVTAYYTPRYCKRGRKSKAVVRKYTVFRSDYVYRSPQ